MASSQANASVGFPQGVTGLWSGRLLAGLQAGVLAGLCMTGWLMMESLRRGQPVWSTPNLVSTVLLGRRGLDPTFGAATLAGLSLLVVVAGMHGIVFAALMPPASGPLWAANAGVLFSLSSYGFFFGWALGYLAPLFSQRASRPAWIGAHFLFGMILGLYPDFAMDFQPSEKPTEGTE